jgi:uncharacterized membrane protein YqiK
VESHLLLPIFVVTAVILLLGLFVVPRSYRAVRPNQALVISSPSGARVARRGTLVSPFLHRVDLLELGVHAIELRLAGREGVVCRDGIRADVVAVFMVRVNPTDEDILRIAAQLGCERASTPEGLRSLLAPGVENAVRAAFADVKFDELNRRRELLCDRIVEAVNEDLGGLCLDAVELRQIESTPLEQLDPNNVTDAVAIRKLTERTRAP